MPLIAFLLALALSRSLFSGSASSGIAHSGQRPTAPSTLTSLGGAAYPVTSPTPTAKPSTAAPSPSATATDPARSLQPATYSQSPAPTTITSVSITSLGYDLAAFGQARVTVEVRTSGTARVDVAIKITEPGGSYGYGSGYGYGYGYGPGPGYPGTVSRTDPFTESGRQDYTITDTFPVGSYCSRYGAPVAAAVSVSATVPGRTAAPMTATADLWAVRC